MIIKLKNVRQHEDLTLELPDSGVVRLNGRSGIGKTTVFDAIEEALYGSASDMAPWGSSKSSVELSIGQMDIIRTRGPQTLTVKHGDITLKDDEAQEFINKTIGMTEQEFLACSYIKQGSANSLLSLGPADQLRFIEALSIGDANPELIKDKIKTLIKKCEKDLLINETIKSQLIEKIEENKDKIINLSYSLGEKPELPFTEAEYTSKVGELEAVEAEALVIQSKIFSLEQSIKNPLFELLKSGTALIESNEAKMSAINEMIAAAEKDLSSIRPWSDSSEAETINIIDLINKQKEFIIIKDKIREISKVIAARYPDIREYESVSSLLIAKKNLYRDRISSLTTERFQLIEKQRELGALKIPQYCPSCEAPLSIVSNRIVSSSDVPKNLPELKKELEDMLGALNRRAGEDTSEEAMINAWLLECARLKESLPPKEPYPQVVGMEECLSQLKNLNVYLIENTKLVGKQRELQNNINKFNDLIIELKNKNTSIAADLVAARALVPFEQLVLEKSNYINNLNSKTIQAATLKSELEDYRKTIQSVRRHESIEVVLNQLKFNQETADKELVVAEVSNRELNEKLAAAVRLKELSDFAAVSAIDSTLDDVNACSAFFLEKMFPEDGTVIKLKNSTTTKTGEERAKLSIEIFHKGKCAKRLSNLSGGEKSRACLAFQLGLSELYKSPILMIDEGFSGLGDNDKEQCLEVLHDVVKDKLVLVVEHGAGSSHFDATINIGE